MNTTGPPPGEKAVEAIAAIVVALCLLVGFVFILSYCKCSKYLHLIGLKCCPGDYSRVELGEIQESL